MKQKRLPVIVTTYQALQGCLTDHVRLIYVDGKLYLDLTEQIHRIMMEHGYELADVPARKGVFYTKDISTDTMEIYDPCNLY